jgi:hypothetical protein
MATKPIKGSEIIEVGALDNHISQLKELKTLYETLDKDVLKFAAESKKAAKGFKASNNEDVKRAIQLEKQLTAEIVEQEKRERAKIQTEKTLLTLSKAKQNMSARTKKAIADENNAYKQQSKTLTDLINRYQNLAARGRENGKVARGLLTEITKLDTGLKKIDATVGRHQRNVGNYKTALTGLGKTYRSVIGLASQFGIAMGGAMIVRNSVNIIQDFEQANANLAAILGTTADKTKNLQEQQLALGGSTSFTAAQVAELQTEFAKLGFTQNEIIQATEGTLFLAKAAGTDLANAAEIAGSTLRAFNFDASEMGRVTDVMAKSFSTSALDITKFKESMKLVAPIAAAAGVSLEEATAMLGALANAGISGSMAGTSLRRILNEVAKTGKPVAQALAEMSEKGLTLADAEDEVGKNAQTALLVLTQQMDTVGDLTAQYENASGTAKEMAETQDNTLGGSIARLISKWQEFIIKLSQSSGAGATLRKVIDFLAKNLENILNVVIEVGKAFVVYKATILSLQAVEKVSNALMIARTGGLKALFIQQTAVNTATATGTKTMNIFNKTVKANPIGLIVTAVISLIMALKNLSKEMSGTEKGYKSLDEARKESQQAIVKEKLELEKLILVAKDETISKEKREQAIKSINEISPEYLGNITLENVNTQEVTKSIEKYIEALEKKAYQQAINNKLTDAYSRLIEAETSAIKDHSGAVSWALYLQGRTDLADNYELLTKAEKIQSIKDEIEVLKGVYIENVKNQSATEYSTEVTKENTSAIDKNNKSLDDKKNKLTGLAKLEKELSDLEKKRSDYLVDNKGVVDEEFIGMTKISRELKEQIDSLREKLKLEQEEVKKKDDFPERLKKIQDEESVAEAYRRRQLNEEQTELDDLANRLSDELLLAGDNNDLKLKLEEEYQKNKAEIEKKYADARQKEIDDAELKKQQEKLEAQKQIAQNLTDLTVMLANRRIEALERENQIQQQIFEQSMARESQIISMREANNSSLENSLAFEKEAQAKALQEQSKIAKKKARIEMFMNGMQLLNSYVQQGKGVGNVIGDMTALTSALEQIVPAFWTGTDTTVGDAVGVKYSNKRDGVLARIDPSEMVLNKTKVDTLAKYGVNSTDEIVRRVQMGSMFNVPSVTTSQPISINNKILEQKIDNTNALLQQIAQKPTSQLDIEQLDRLVTISETISTPTKRTTVIKHKRLGR